MVILHLRAELAKVVAVEMEDGGVHGDLPGHVGQVPGGALNHVEGPGLVVIARTGVRAFHSAVTGKEGATPEVSNSDWEKVMIVSF